MIRNKEMGNVMRTYTINVHYYTKTAISGSAQEANVLSLR